jgi:hypothetical protein
MVLILPNHSASPSGLLKDSILKVVERLPATTLITKKDIHVQLNHCDGVAPPHPHGECAMLIVLMLRAS